LSEKIQRHSPNGHFSRGRSASGFGAIRIAPGRTSFSLAVGSWRRNSTDAGFESAVRVDRECSRPVSVRLTDIIKPVRVETRLISCRSKLDALQASRMRRMVSETTRVCPTTHRRRANDPTVGPFAGPNLRPCAVATSSWPARRFCGLLRSPFASAVPAKRCATPCMPLSTKAPSAFTPSPRPPRPFPPSGRESATRIGPLGCLADEKSRQGFAVEQRPPGGKGDVRHGPPRRPLGSCPAWIGTDNPSE
jgi:hypothetical protein